VIPPSIGLVLVALLGLCIGSFLNVVIARLPAEKSLFSPRSACPRCAVPILWYDNIPVLSYAVLAGRCRSCQAPISPRYPIVETLTASLFALAFLKWGMSPALVPALVLIAGLVAITVIDLDHQIIPDVITLPGIVVGLGWNLATQQVPRLEAAVGVLVGGGLFLIIIVASRGGMGGGDMKLGAMLGAFLGWKLVLVASLLAVLAGGVVAIWLLAASRKGRKDPVPFGPFLALGGIASLFLGHELLAWYLGAFSG
jgi:leader peptidase (prepilin peptidase)/N-methyltransferase